MGTTRAAEIDDAVQDVFVECFKDGGILDRVESDRPGGFRAYLFGVVRNVARRYEAVVAANHPSPDRPEPELDVIIQSERGLSLSFDRAWARAIMREAADAMAERAKIAGPDAGRRVDLLHLRFYDGLSIREIANRWQGRFGCYPPRIRKSAKGV